MSANSPQACHTGFIQKCNSSSACRTGLTVTAPQQWANQGGRKASTLSCFQYVNQTMWRKQLYLTQRDTAIISKAQLRRVAWSLVPDHTVERVGEGEGEGEGGREREQESTRESERYYSTLFINPMHNVTLPGPREKQHHCEQCTTSYKSYA